MIVIKVEMWPGGDESKAEEFGRMILANQVATTLRTGGSHGDYSVILLGGVWGRQDLLKRNWKTGKVTGFNRQARGAWDLIREALNNCLGGR